MPINFREWFRREAMLLFPPQAFSGGDFATAADVAAGTLTTKTLTPKSAAALRGHGEVRLVLNGANLQLNRYGSGFGRLFVGGSQVQISNVGPTLAPSFSGSVPNTTYYIYCYDPASPTLEASTTAPTYSTTYGIMVKTGDISRTLVGMARTTIGPAWVDSEALRFVSSYFNRRQRGLYVPLTADKTPTGSNAEITTNTERAYFLTWADQPVVAGARVCCLQGSGNSGLYIMLGLDGTAITNSHVGDMLGFVGCIFNNSIPPYSIDMSEGLHFIGLHAYITGTASSQVYGATAPGTAIQGTIWG